MNHKTIIARNTAILYRNGPTGPWILEFRNSEGRRGEVRDLDRCYLEKLARDWNLVLQPTEEKK